MADVVIIGGGITGLLSAHYLAAEGAVVTLVERGECFREASWAGGGILAPMHPWRYADSINELVFESESLYPALCEQLQEKTGIDCELQVSGMLQLALAPEDEILARQWCERRSRVCEVLDQAQLQNLNILSTQFSHALLMPETQQIRNPRLGKALLAALQTNPAVTLHTQTEVNVIETEPLRVVTDHGVVSAGKVLVCAGAWTSRLIAEYSSLQIKPVKGEMLLLKAEPGLLPYMLMCHGRYMIPRADGHILVGSTQQDSGFDKTLNVETAQLLQQHAQDVVPALEGAPVVRHWSGLRPATNDELPFVGSLPDRPDIYVCGGHFRNGLAMGPASALRIARQIVAS